MACKYFEERFCRASEEVVIYHTQNAHTPFLPLAPSPFFVISKRNPAVGDFPGAAGAVRTREARRGRCSGLCPCGRRATWPGPIATVTSAGRCSVAFCCSRASAGFSRAGLGFACFVCSRRETAIIVTR